MNPGPTSCLRCKSYFYIYYYILSIVFNLHSERLAVNQYVWIESTVCLITEGNFLAVEIKPQIYISTLEISIKNILTFKLIKIHKTLVLTQHFFVYIMIVYFNTCISYSHYEKLPFFSFVCLFSVKFPRAYGYICQVLGCTVLIHTCKSMLIYYMN